MYNKVGFNTTCASTNTFAPVKKDDTRRIVREEIQRQKQLDKLEEKYNNGEISKFEYKLAKAMLTIELPEVKPSYSTTAFSQTI